MGGKEERRDERGVGGYSTDIVEQKRQGVSKKDRETMGWTDE